MAEPLSIHYGKDAVSFYRTDDAANLFAADVELVLHGDVFLPSYTEGDNSMVVATDSMKNFIHRAALRFSGESLEDFLVEAGERFLERYEHVDALELRGLETVFARRVGGVLQRLHDDHGIVEMSLYRGGERLERSGLHGLQLVKLSGSSFAGFVRDEYTTLPEAWDRPLFVHLNVGWRHADFDRRVASEAVRDSVIATFDDFVSASIQHLVHEMGVRALDRFPEIEEIEFDGQNRLWDTARSAEGVAVYTDARPPFGVIHLTLRR